MGRVLITPPIIICGFEITLLVEALLLVLQSMLKNLQECYRTLLPHCGSS
jgi:hypothetical protein